MLKTGIEKIAIGGLGIVSTEGIPEIINVISTSPSEVVNVLVQIIIGIATLFGLFKRKKVAR